MRPVSRSSHVYQRKHIDVSNCDPYDRVYSQRPRRRVRSKTGRKRQVVQYKPTTYDGHVTVDARTALLTTVITRGYVFRYYVILQSHLWGWASVARAAEKTITNATIARNRFRVGLTNPNVNHPFRRYGNDCRYDWLLHYVFYVDDDE